jgi:hypothetical protein
MNSKEILEKAIQKAIDSYNVTTKGVVISKKSGKELKGSVNQKGYRYIAVYLPEFKKQKKITIHRLVALTYLDNPNDLPHINHIDGNRLNNRVENLEWCTVSYNVSDGFKRGRVIWNKNNMSKERILGYAKKYPRQIFWYLTANDFAAAKALWGLAVDDATHKNNWHYHLQQMVIADDPIQYLGEHI